MSSEVFEAKLDSRKTNLGALRKLSLKGTSSKETGEETIV